MKTSLSIKENRISLLSIWRLLEEKREGKKRKVVEYFSRFLVTDILFSGGTQQRLREQGKVLRWNQGTSTMKKAEKRKKKERKKEKKVRCI